MIYKGFLNINEYGVLNLDSEPLVELIESNFKINETISVRYYITDIECRLEDVNKALIFKTLGGDITQLYFNLDAYSEYTIMDLQQDLVIGGHNLFSELESYDGRYLILIVERAPEINFGSK